MIRLCRACRRTHYFDTVTGQPVPDPKGPGYTPEAVCPRRVELIWRVWVRRNLVEDRREYDAEDIQMSEGVTPEEAAELSRRTREDR